MHFWFEHASDGRVRARVGPELFHLQEVLDDGLGLPPPWPLEDGPQTTDITHTHWQLEAAVRQGESPGVV